MLGKTVRKTVTKTAVFLLIGVLLFGLLQAMFVEKSSYAKYRAWKSVDNVDILVLGNSHADCGIQAGMMSQDLGESAGSEVSVFNYAIFGMRMEQMYYFAREAFKTHVPDLVVLETYAFCPLLDEHREILARRAFDVFPLSRNKIEALNYCVLGERASYYIPFIKYHTRWKELSSLDVRLLYDSSLWPACGSDGTYVQDIQENPGDGWFQQAVPEDTREITPSEQECFDKFLELLEGKGVSLLLVSVPFKVQMDLNSIEQVRINNYLQERYVNGTTVQMLDMNRLWTQMGFDYSDLMNEGHVNRAGGAKVTACLSDYLKEHYPLSEMAS